MIKPDSEILKILSQARVWWERLSLPIVLVDFSSLNIIYANPRSEELIGKPMDTLVGLNWVSVFDSEAVATLKSVGDLYKIDFDAFMPTEYNLRVLRRSGRSVPVICSFSGLIMEGRKLLLLSFFDLSKDVAEKQRLAEDLKSIYQMSKLADLGRIASSVAHEMNNPLMVIQGQAEILELKVAKGPLSSKDVEGILYPIYRSIERMTQIIGQMRSAALPAGTDLKKVDLTQVIRDGLVLLEPRAKFLGVEIDSNLPGPVLIEANQNQMEQVILNIVNNAFDSMEDEKFQIKSGLKLRVEEKVEDGFAVVSIYNNGPPIPIEFQQNVMSPFFSTKDIGKGPGLGLSVSMGIVKAHHGGLKLKYSNEQGTCFEFKIPTSSRFDEKMKVKVLVVDDEVFVRDVLFQRLQSEGFEVVLARNGSEALEEIMNHPDIAVLFTDLRMPTMAGLELIRHIRSIMNEVLVIVISGFLDSLNEAEGQDLALIDETLEKPFTGAEFRRVLDFVHQKIEQKRKSSV